MFKKYICTMCGYVGYPSKKSKGSILVEIALWLCFGLPGLIYTLWRLTSSYDVCPECNNPSMIPTDSPMGRKLLKTLQEDE